MVDTSVLAARIAGFKSWRDPENPSARLLRDWIENASFTWLVTEEILAEYNEVLLRLGCSMEVNRIPPLPVVD